jgi:hypothetical protein
MPSFSAGTVSPIANTNLLMQVFAFGRHDGRLSLNISEGGMAYPRTGSFSPHVTNFSTLPSVTVSLLPAEN